MVVAAAGGRLVELVVEALGGNKDDAGALGVGGAMIVASLTGDIVSLAPYAAEKMSREKAEAGDKTCIAINRIARGAQIATSLPHKRS